MLRFCALLQAGNEDAKCVGLTHSTLSVSFLSSAINSGARALLPPTIHRLETVGQEKVASGVDILLYP